MSLIVRVVFGFSFSLYTHYNFFAHIHQSLNVSHFFTMTCICLSWFSLQTVGHCQINIVSTATKPCLIVEGCFNVCPVVCHIEIVVATSTKFLQDVVNNKFDIGRSFSFFHGTCSQNTGTQLPAVIYMVACHSYVRCVCRLMGPHVAGDGKLPLPHQVVLQCFFAFVTSLVARALKPIPSTTLNGRMSFTHMLTTASANSPFWATDNLWRSESDPHAVTN